jgi:hypothetical protein
MKRTRLMNGFVEEGGLSRADRMNGFVPGRSASRAGRMSGFVEGHGFSRADRGSQRPGALAPAGRCSEIFPRKGVRQ